VIQVLKDGKPALVVARYRRRSPNTLMKKLAKIVCVPRVSNSAAGMTSRIV
jgi:hypothetical protein